MFTYTKMMALALMAMMTFTSCSNDDEDGYIASTLRNHDWQGYIGAYYQDRWGISGSEYSTVLHFSSKDAYYTSGRGEELDFNTASPRHDYAYCTFKWFIVDGDITLIYDDSMWSPVYISDYTLYSDYFAGYMNDGTRRDIRFELDNVRFGYWDTYRSYYEDDYYYYDDYYYSRTRAADSTLTAPADSTMLPTPDSIVVVNNGKSIVSGAFAGNAK